MQYYVTSALMSTKLNMNMKNNKEEQEKITVGKQNFVLCSFLTDMETIMTISPHHFFGLFFFWNDAFTYFSYFCLHVSRKGLFHLVLMDGWRAECDGWHDMELVWVWVDWNNCGFLFRLLDGLKNSLD